MDIRIPLLNRSFEVSDRTLASYPPGRLAPAIEALRGRTLGMAFEPGADGAQTADRLVRRDLGRAGVRWTEEVSACEGIVWIQRGGHEGRFAFVVADPAGNRPHVAGDCGPRELTATLMTAICEFLKQRGDASGSAESTGSDDLTLLLEQLDDENRRITSGALAQDHRAITQSMGRLAAIARELGGFSDPRVVKPLSDLLADAALARESLPCSEAEELVEVTMNALCRVGEISLPLIRKHSRHENPAIRRVFGVALTRASRGGSTTQGGTGGDFFVVLSEGWGAYRRRVAGGRAVPFGATSSDGAVVSIRSRDTPADFVRDREQRRSEILAELHRLAPDSRENRVAFGPASECLNVASGQRIGSKGVVGHTSIMRGPLEFSIRYEVPISAPYAAIRQLDALVVSFRVTSAPDLQFFRDLHEGRRGKRRWWQFWRWLGT